MKAGEVVVGAAHHRAGVMGGTDQMCGVVVVADQHTCEVGVVA